MIHMSPSSFKRWPNILDVTNLHWHMSAVQPQPWWLADIQDPDDWGNVIMRLLNNLSISAAWLEQIYIDFISLRYY